MVERVNGKVTVNVLDKIKFDSLDHMKKSIFNYFYSYNYHIKHSGINRLTPIQYLENEFTENKDKFKYTFEVFNLKNKTILDGYRVGPDNYLIFCNHFVISCLYNIYIIIYGGLLWETKKNLG